MTDEELRCLVRNAIAQHLSSVPPKGGTHNTEAAGRSQDLPPWRAHPSFGKFLMTSGADESGPCLIEPSVACNHCGFCKSYGH